MVIANQALHENTKVRGPGVEATGCVASSRIRPLTPLVGKFSKSKVGPKKIRGGRRWEEGRGEEGEQGGVGKGGGGGSREGGGGGSREGGRRWEYERGRRWE